MIIDLSGIASSERFLACAYLARPEVKSGFFDDPTKLTAAIVFSGLSFWTCNKRGLSADGQRTVVVTEGQRTRTARAAMAVASAPFIAARHTAASILDLSGIEAGDWFDALRMLANNANAWIALSDEIGVTTKRALGPDGRLVERRIDVRHDRVIFTSRYVDLVAEALAATEGLPMPPAADNDCDEEDAQESGGAA